MFHTEIHVKGKLNPRWSYWFEDMHIQIDAYGNTVLSGLLPDKSCVYGILSRLSSLGITLISVSCTEDTSGMHSKYQQE
jgi:hypothetical protein